MAGLPDVAELGALGPQDRIRIDGPNGCGKTTLLRRLAGLPEPGSDDLPGHRPLGTIVMEAPLEGLVGLTVAGEARMRRTALRPETLPLARRDVATLSSGEARSVALALCPSDGLLLLDEATEGLDQAALAALRRRIESHRGPVVYTDHAGRLPNVSTRTVRLGAMPSSTARRIRAGPTLAKSAATTVQRATQVRLPAVILRAGLVVVAGPNGCGKTTMLRHLAGLHGTPSPLPSTYVPADAGRRLAQPVSRNDVSPLVDEAMVGRHPLSMSAGEAHRVALARAFAATDPLLLLDEPEARLDAAGRQALLACIEAVADQGRCVVAASHDPWLAGCATDTVSLGGA